MDRHGALIIPERMAEFVGLQQEAILIGVRDHFELWDAHRWQQYLEQHVPNEATTPPEAADGSSEE